MKRLVPALLILISIVLLRCGNPSSPQSGATTVSGKNLITHATGLSIYSTPGYSVVTVTDPWPEAKGSFTYILKKKNAVVPDSLASFQVIQVPVKKIVVTSTTHIPSLDMLGVENTLVGFPNLQYISSEKVRRQIENGKVRELGSNQALNTEVVIDLNPDVIIGFGIDNSNPAIANLQKSGLKVILNGDWNEKSPLGKAEWIKLFGVLYGLEDKAAKIFEDIAAEYNYALQLAKNVSSQPTVMAGAIYENRWYLPQGQSWGAITIADAGGNYLWKDSPGSGSLSLPFEKVLEKAASADVWIGPAQFISLTEMAESNPHYNKFKAFQAGKVYSFSTKKGKTGGVVYYELAPNRPDLVLKDVVRILHPELLPNHKLFFFEQLK